VLARSTDGASGRVIALERTTDLHPLRPHPHGGIPNRCCRNQLNAGTETLDLHVSGFGDDLIELGCPATALVDTAMCPQKCLCDAVTSKRVN
jgi:hypothetical protein